MQKRTTPLRRSEQLAPLSREHHDGLLFVWKIRQGIAYGIPAERIAQYCSWYWQNILRAHFQQEERVLSTLLPADDALLNTMKEDHGAITEKIEEIIDAPSRYALQRLAQILYYHIRFEERDLFTHAEQVAREQLSKVAGTLPVQRKPAVQWADEFWTRRPKASQFEMALH